MGVKEIQEVLKAYLGSAETYRIRFRGEPFLLIGSIKDGRPWEGAIARQQDFDEFNDSFAHLYENGTILRRGKQIGSREDIAMEEGGTALGDGL